MKIKELIEVLKEFDENLEVCTAIDDEGNGYRPLYWVTPGHINDDDEYYFTSYEVDEDGEEIYPTVQVTIDKATAICLG